MGTIFRFVVLVLIVVAMAFGTKAYTDSRYRTSQDLYDNEMSYCRALREAGRPMSAGDREVCDNRYRRNGDRNDRDETIAMVLWGAIALFALIGAALIIYFRKRRAPLASGSEPIQP